MNEENSSSKLNDCVTALNHFYNTMQRITPL